MTRSQHPDLRLFRQISGKMGWLSNRSYKTVGGAETHMHRVVRASGDGRRIGYKVVQCTDGLYRVLATPAKQVEVK